MPPARIPTVGEEHGDLGASVGECLGGHRDRGAVEQSVRALTELEWDTGQPEPAPLVGELLGPERIEHEVDGTELIRHQRAGVLDRSRRRQVELVDEDQHHVAIEDASGRGERDVLFELDYLGLVLPLQTEERETMIGTAAMTTHAPCRTS